MRHRCLMALSVTAVVALLGCARRIDLGSLGSETGGAGGSTSVDEGTGGAGGSEPLPPPGPDFPERLIFASDFESGDLVEWGIDSERLETAAGVFSVESERAQAGAYSALITTDTLGEHITVSTSFNERELLIGFWLLLQDTYNTGNWPILHLDQLEGAGTTELWDLGFQAAGDGVQTFFLWEKPALAGTVDGSRIANASEPFGLNRWVHLQVHWLAENDEQGFLRVYQDENLVMEVADHPTSLGGEVQVSFGSFIYSIEPLPAAFWLDAITVHTR